MPIPDYQTLMLPLLTSLKDGRIRTTSQVLSSLAGDFHLTHEELDERFPSSGSNVFHNRISWARTYLKHAGLLTYPKRGLMQITERGRSVLQEQPEHIDNVYLRRFAEFEDFLNRNKPQTGENPPAAIYEATTETPKELIESGYSRLRTAVEADILAAVKTCSPEVFEHIVVRLLTVMGYGGFRPNTGLTLSRSNDGSVDGVIKEDKLGIDRLYVQAKRWDSATVGRTDVQGFVGALHGRKAKKGVFITTSMFASDAQRYAEDLSDPRIVLVDGPQLAALLFDHNLGVATVNTYFVKEVDTDFFEDEHS